MAIAYNPTNGLNFDELKKNKSFSKYIIFDLLGQSVYAKGTLVGKVYQNFQKSTSSTTGLSGLVPFPDYNNNSNTRFLREDGTWTDAVEIKSLTATSFSTYLKSSIIYGYNSKENETDGITGDFGIFNMQTSNYTSSDHFYFRQFRGQAGIDKLYTRLYYKRQNENITYTDWKEILTLGTYTTLAGYGITDAVNTTSGQFVDGTKYFRDTVYSTRFSSFVKDSKNSIIEGYASQFYRQFINGVDNGTQILNVTDGAYFGLNIRDNIIYVNDNGTYKAIYTRENGLRADKLGSKSESDFVDLTSEQTISGVKTFTKSLYFNTTGFGSNGWARGLNYINNGSTIGGIGAYGASENKINRLYIGWGSAPESINTSLSVGESVFTYKNNIIWHAGNMGEGSGLNADMLDGLHKDSFQQAVYTYFPLSQGTDIANTTTLANIIANNKTGDKDNFKFYDTKFYSSSSVASETSNRAQIAYGYAYDKIHFRRYYNGAWTDWKTVAFTDSNVASASKLATARTLWGKSFDGTADVSGSITIGTSPVYGADSAILMQRGTSGALSIGSNKDTKLYLSTGEYMYFRTTDSNGTYQTNMFLTNKGRLGIGATLVSPEKTLHVAGDALITGDTTINSALTVNGTAKATTFEGNLNWSYITNKPDIFTQTEVNNLLKGCVKNVNVQSTETIYTNIDSIARNSFTHDYRWVNHPSQINDISRIGSVLDISYSGDWRSQLFFSMNLEGRIYHRNRYNGTTWDDSWKVISYLSDLTSNNITLKSYSKATSIGSLADNDSLNTALGKLELKTDTIYTWYKGITEDDTDTLVNKWGEIVDFLDSVAEGTDITDEFVTRKTDQEIIGSKTFNTNIIIKSVYDSKLILNNTDDESKYQQIVFQQNGEEYGRLGTYYGNNICWNNNIILDANNYTNYKHSYTNLTGSGTTANQAIVSTGTANGWTLKTVALQSEIPQLASKGLFKRLTSSGESNSGKWKKFARIDLSNYGVYSECGGYMFIYDNEGHRVKGILDFHVRTTPDTNINTTNINLQSPYLKWHVLNDSSYSGYIKMIKVQNGIFDLYIYNSSTYTTYQIQVFTLQPEKITLLNEGWIVESSLPSNIICTSSWGTVSYGMWGDGNSYTIPYINGSNYASFLKAPTTESVLMSKGGAPYWTSKSSLEVGTAISLKQTTLTDGFDLNDAKSEGVYTSTQTTICINLKNGPVDRVNGEARLEVTNCGSNTHIIQKLITKNGSYCQIWYRYYTGSTWGSWKQVAFISDIPTKVSQLTNDSGYLTSTNLTNYVTLNNNQTITGLKTFNSDIVLGAGTNSSYALKMYSNTSTYRYFYAKNDELYFDTSNNSGKIWRADNDGSGSGLDADTLDTYHETDFFRTNRGSIATSYIDLSTYTNDHTDFKNYDSGTYNVPRSGYSDAYVVFKSTGSTSAVELMTSYQDTARLKLRKTVDSKRVSGPWRELAFTSDIPTVTDYYWADVKISSTSKTDTTPTFWKVKLYGDSLIGTVSSNYLWQQTSGNELVITGSTNAASNMYVNYRTVTNSYTPTTWIWNAGSSTTYADFEIGNLTSYGNIKIPDNKNIKSSSGYVLIGAGTSSGFTGGLDTTSIVVGGSNLPTIIRTSANDLYHYRGDTSTRYSILDTGNSSVSGGGSTWGSSITINLGGTSKTLTIPSKPSYSWTDISDKPVYSWSGSAPLDIIQANYGTMATNQFISAYLAHGSGSIAMGYRISGYKDTQYGGWFGATYSKPWFIGASAGTWTLQNIITDTNYTTYTVTKTGSGASGTWGINITGTAGSINGSYTSQGGKQNPDYFGKNKVGFLMMNTTVNNNSNYKDWMIMDCYAGSDAGGAVAFGVNRQSLGAYIMRSAAERTSWAESAELLGTHNYSSYALPLTGGTISGDLTVNSILTSDLGIYVSNDGILNDGYAIKSNGNTYIDGNLISTGTVQFNKLKIPTSSGGSTYGAGSNGQVLKSNGTTVYWANDNNYYPTAFSWTNGTGSGPTGSLTVSGTDSVSFGSIPSASNSQSGIVTTTSQNFVGIKTFYSDIRTIHSARIEMFDNEENPTTSRAMLGNSDNGVNTYIGLFSRRINSWIITLHRDTSSQTKHGICLDPQNKTRVIIGADSANITDTSKLYVNGNITASGEITAYSDKRLKSNIQTLENRGYIEPVTFEKNGKKCIGFIAQNVEEKYPELVSSEGEYLSLNYQQYTAVLQAQIIELEKRIKELENGIRK